jgi:hypothetical protein
VTVGVLFIVYLVALGFVSMLMMWQYVRRQRIERRPSSEVRFALREAETILGVKVTAETMFFCIGNSEEHVHDEEDTVK